MNNSGLDNENYYVSENENPHEDKIEDKSNDTLAIKNILLYKNGDLYFPGKRFVMNKKYIRNWESFLEELTKNLNPVNGAIRDIRTPFHGTRITSLDDLTANGKYIAISKGEKLKLIDYSKTININTPPQPAKSNSFRLKPLRLANHDMEKIESRIAQDLYVKSSVIFVYRNGDPFTRAIKIVVKPQDQKHMSILVKAIEDRVLLQTNKPIRRLYTLNGDLIRYAKDVEDGKYYVAASFEDFKNIKYGQFLPVIRGGRVSSKRNQIKFLNQIPSANPDERSQRTTVDENSEQQEKTLDSPHNKPKNPEKRTQKTNVKQKSEKEKAATKIQAAFRGFHTRKEIEKALENNEPIPTKQLTYVPKKQKIRNPEKETVEPEKSNKVNYNKTKKEEKVPQEKQLKNQIKPKTEKVETKKPPPKNNNSKVAHSDDEITKAAIKIQAGFRGYQTRHYLKNVKSDKPIKNTENKNVNKVQSKSENRQPDKNDNNNKKNNDNSNNNQENKEVKAAVIIQAGFRGYHTRKNMKNNSSQKSNNVPSKEKETKSNNNQENKEEKAAVIIQAGFRGYHTRKNMKNNSSQKSNNVSSKEKEIKSNNNQENKEEKAAVIIQAGFRGYHTRKNMKNNSSQKSNNVFSKEKETNSEPKSVNSKEEKHDPVEEEKAAIKIQAGFRGYKQRKNLKIRDHAAQTIQAGFRGFKTRKLLKQNAKQIPSDNHNDSNNNEQEEAAKRIQAGFRGFKVRKELKFIEERQRYAATKIQAGFRGYKTRKEFKNKEKSAERIQAGFRSYKTRKELSNNTIEKPKYLTPEEQAEERNEAAAKIQAAFRGHIYRRDHT